MVNNDANQELGRSLAGSEILPGWSKDHHENPVDFPSQPKQIKEQLEAVFSFTETMCAWGGGRAASASRERGALCVVRVSVC